MPNARRVAQWMIAVLVAGTFAAAACAQAQPRDPPGMRCFSMSGDPDDLSARACTVIGPYEEQCGFSMVDNWRNPSMLIAICDNAVRELALPCRGLVFFEQDRLECRGVPAQAVRPPRPRPQATEAIAGCTRIRFVPGWIEAECKRRNGQPNRTRLQLPCPGEVANNDGRLICVPPRAGRGGTTRR